MPIEISIQKRLGNFVLDVDLKSESKRLGILGASGCGKSMTLKSIAGIETPDQGKITIDDKVVYHSAEKINWKPQKRNIGYLFQNYALFPAMSVRANIAAGLKGSKAQQRERVGRMLEKFRLQGLENRLPGQLSGGQQQRVALARIMAYEPDAILLDEPYSALDEFLKERLQQEMQEMLADYEGTVLLVSHNRDEIYRFSDELLVMDQGRVICSGETKTIFQDPGRREAARLTGCKNIAPARPLDAHHIEVEDWGVTLNFEGEVPEWVRFVGFRAHDFIPVWEEAGENCIPADIKSTAELPFETRYFIKSFRENREEICWFVQRDRMAELDRKGIPKYLFMPEEKILLLK